MARVSTYLNFPGTTEAAFVFYKAVFQSEFSAPIARFGDMPCGPDQPPCPRPTGILSCTLNFPFWAVMC